MNTHELIETTMLHALGMLDDNERQAYEAAYEAAPVAVRALVRDEARRMADLGDLMGTLDSRPEPSEELRALVLAAVRAAMREEENEARIARTMPSLTLGAASSASVAGRISHQRQDDAAPGHTPQPSPQPAPRKTSQPRLSTSKRVHRMWRIAAVGCAAAAIAMGVVMINLNQTYKQAQSGVLVTSLYDTIGAKYLESTIFDANTQRVAMTSADASSTAVAAVWSNPDWKTARLFVKNLSTTSGKPLRLVVLDPDGNIFREIATFTPTGKFEDFDVNVNLSTERKLAIYPAMSQDIKAVSPVLLSAEGTL